MTIRNQWDIFNLLTIEPEVKFENMLIDVMIANVTEHFEAVLSNASCEPKKRRRPKFMSGKRIRRSAFGRVFKKIFKKSGKFVGWTATLTIAGTIGSNTAVWLDHYLSKQDYMSIMQQEPTCRSFNYGCEKNICWANCGNRNDSADWCFTKANTNSNQTSLFERLKVCNHDKDCNPCDECASECFIDNS